MWKRRARKNEPRATFVPCQRVQSAEEEDEGEEEGKGEEGWVSATAEREALIEFGFVWIIVKRLKRPETNLFASGRESFLVEDNKWSEAARHSQTSA